MGGDGKPSYETLVRRVEELESLADQAGVARQTLPGHDLGLPRILEATGEGFWLVDRRQGRLLVVNDGYCRLSGYSRPELLAMTVSMLDAQETPAEVVAHMERIRQCGHDTFTTTHRRKDGSLWPVEISVGYSDVQGGQLIVFLRDISTRAQGEEKMKKMMEELELLVEERANELQRKSIALSEVLRQIDVERHELESKINSNVQTLLLPIIDKLIEKATSIDARYLKILKQNLLELTSARGVKLSSRDYNLTPKETELCALIKGGFTVKEIAAMQGLSERTVESHRYNIRKKLSISSSKTNLVTFLASL